jgi:alpha-tubulin suppressor-like RCC1 family protein
VVSVAAGGYHSGAFTRKGDVYMWGFNRSGQCGVGAKGINTVSVPTVVDGMKELRGAGRAVQLVCGRHHSSLLTETGAVYSWGATSFGRLGIHDLTSKKTALPKRVTTLDHFAVKMIKTDNNNNNKTSFMLFACVCLL